MGSKRREGEVKVEKWEGEEGNQVSGMATSHTPVYFSLCLVCPTNTNIDNVIMERMNILLTRSSTIRVFHHYQKKGCSIDTAFICFTLSNG